MHFAFPEVQKKRYKLVAPIRFWLCLIASIHFHHIYVFFYFLYLLRALHTAQ